MIFPTVQTEYRDYLVFVEASLPWHCVHSYRRKQCANKTKILKQSGKVTQENVFLCGKTIYIV